MVELRLARGAWKPCLTAVIILSLIICVFKILDLREDRDQLLVEKRELLEENAKFVEWAATGGWTGYRSNGAYQTRIEGFSAADSMEVDIVFLGDSLVENWQVDLSFPRVRCMNQGISGDVTEGVLNRLNLVEVFAPEVVVLEIGTNDLVRIGDVDSAAGNVRAIVDYLREGGVGEVVLLGLPPAPDNQKEVNEKKIALSERYRAISQELDNVHYVELFSVFLLPEGYRDEDFFCDDKHLSAAGYARLNQVIAETLDEVLLRKE